ncbi:MAG TPA: PAS domain S-box protein [Coleofasciculaceae cyanobacterium]
MNLDELTQQIHDMHQRVAQLQQRIGESSLEQQQLETIATTLNELNIALEELQVANEELYQQNEQLSAAQQAVELQRQRYQELFEFAPDPYLVTDLHGTIQEANCAAAILFNHSQTFLVGKPLSLYVAEEERKAFRTQLNRLRYVDGVQEWEMNLQLRNHTLISVGVRAAATCDHNGNPIELRWLLRDITQRKQEESLQTLNEKLENRVRERTAALETLNEQLLVAIADRTVVEEALHEREQEFRALVEHAPDVIERFDREFRHLYVNPAIESLTGKSPTEFIGKTNRELGVSEPNLALWEQALGRVFQTGQQEQIEFSMDTVKGLKYYQTRLVPEFATDGTPTSVLGISRDITDHKLALEALQESEERFRQLAENIEEVFWMVTPDSTQVLYISPAYEKIWGCSCQSLYDQPNSWMDTVYPDERARVITKLEQQIHGEFTDVEFRIVRPDGSIRWIRDRGFPVRDAAGKIYRVAGIAEDITDRKQAELKIQKALQQERELGEHKVRFVSMTSHEFRNPLTAIQSSTDMLERYRDRLSPEKQLTHLGRIKTAVERMTHMLDDILILGKAEAGKLEFDPKPLDVVQLCRNLVEELQLINKNQQVIYFIYHGDCILTEPNIYVRENTASNSVSSLPLLDEKLLRHVLGNLLSNALKYSPNGSTVQFDFTYVDNKAIFQIQDQGIGIPPEDQPHLFESFQRARNVGTIPGTGLGLAIVKQCVELHQGEITFTSEVGKGTTFTVTLPL